MGIKSLAKLSFGCIVLSLIFFIVKPKKTSASLEIILESEKEFVTTDSQSKPRDIIIKSAKTSKKTSSTFESTFEKTAQGYVTDTIYLNEKQRRKNIITKLLENKITIELAKKCLTDPNYLRGLPQKTAAKMRIMSIDILEAECNYGNETPLLEAIHKLQELLDRDEKLHVGVFHDHVDLISAWFKNKNTSEIEKNIESFLSETGYQKHHRKAYGRALLYAYDGKEISEKALKKYKEYFNEMELL